MSRPPEMRDDETRRAADTTDGAARAPIVAQLDAFDASDTPLGGRERLLRALTTEGRLHRFADDVARLLDIDREAARSLLDRAGTPEAYEPGPYPGVSIYHVEGGRAVEGAVTGFVRIVAGASFPMHEHLGEESVLLVQGTTFDPSSGCVAGPGSLLRASAGDAHETVARPGPDLVFLTVLREGIRVGDTVVRADDPRY